MFSSDSSRDYRVLPDRPHVSPPRRLYPRLTARQLLLALFLSLFLLSGALSSSGSTQAVQLFAPYGAIRYSQGTMPTTYNFTGQRLDSQTGLLYYNFRYYDPVSGRFVRADTTQTNAGGMDPYAYVGNNPEGRTDPTGHCWPWCTALIGAAVGAVIGVAVTTVTSYATTGKPPSGGELLQAAVSGAVSGAIVGVLGPGASVVGAIGIGALTGAAGGVAGRLAYNGVTGKSWSDGLVQAGVEGAVIGGLTGGVLKAAAPLLGRVLSSGLQDEEGVLAGLKAAAIRARLSWNSGIGARAGAAANMLDETGNYITDVARGPKVNFPGIVNSTAEDVYRGGGQCAECHLAFDKIANLYAQGAEIPNPLIMVVDQARGLGPCPACQSNIPTLLGQMGVDGVIYSTNPDVPPFFIRLGNLNW